MTSATAPLLAASTINIECTEVCQTAEGGSCTCSCGGRNHSLANPQRVPYQSDAAGAANVAMNDAQQAAWDATKGTDPTRVVAAAYNQALNAPNPETLDADLFKAFDLYTGLGYNQINGALREDHQEVLAEDFQGEILSTTIERIDEVLDMGTVTSDTAMFRGLRGDFAEQLETGDTIVDPGYLSASYDPVTAAKFGTYDTVLMMDVPKGTHAAYGHSRESEVVLPRGAHVQIIGFEAWEHPETGNVVQIVKAEFREQPTEPPIHPAPEPASAPEPEPEQERLPNFAAMSDDELNAALLDYDTDAALNQIMAELELRETDTPPAPATPEPEPVGALTDDTDSDPDEAAKWAEVEKRVANGEDYEQAWLDVFNVDPEQHQRQRAIDQLRADGYTGRGFDELTRAAFDFQLARDMEAAEDATKGVLFNAQGRRMQDQGRLRTVDLWKQNEAYARRWASEELLNWWDQHDRITLDQYREQLRTGGAATKDRTGGDSWLR